MVIDCNGFDWNVFEAWFVFIGAMVGYPTVVILLLSRVFHD